MDEFCLAKALEITEMTGQFLIFAQRLTTKWENPKECLNFKGETNQFDTRAVARIIALRFLKYHKMLWKNV